MLSKQKSEKLPKEVDVINDCTDYDEYWMDELIAAFVESAENRYDHTIDSYRIEIKVKDIKWGDKKYED